MIPSKQRAQITVGKASFCLGGWVSIFPYGEYELRSCSHRHFPGH